MRMYVESATGNAILVMKDETVATAIAVGTVHPSEARELIRRGNAYEELLTALEAARDWLYNGFEPDNQSVAYHAVKAVVEKYTVESRSQEGLRGFG